MSLAEVLPHVNATLNGLSAVCLVTGFVAVKTGKVEFHKKAMLAAFSLSVLFLASYLTRQFLSGPTEFAGPDGVRVVYLIILFSHMILAALVAPLAITLVVLGLRGRIDKHRRFARFTFPIWLYVSVTGVVVYWMLFQAYQG